ncbi:hypothetical protein EV1_006025 [Malus domestica]
MKQKSIDSIKKGAEEQTQILTSIERQLDHRAKELAMKQKELEHTNQSIIDRDGTGVKRSTDTFDPSRYQQQQQHKSKYPRTCESAATPFPVPNFTPVYPRPNPLSWQYENYGHYGHSGAAANNCEFDDSFGHSFGGSYRAIPNPGVRCPLT